VQRAHPAEMALQRATILLLSGEEKNTLYRVQNGQLRKASEVTIKPGLILGLRVDTPHVVECVGNAPTIGLHVTAATSSNCRAACGIRKPFRSTRSIGHSTKASRVLHPRRPRRQRRSAM